MSFFAGFEKAAAEKSVACVAVVHGGKMLMGVRRDNQKWTNPGGHMEPGEKPVAGAVRELREETGIVADPGELRPLRNKKVTKPDGTKLNVFTFTFAPKVRPRTSMRQDPDLEVQRWRWVPASPALPREVGARLHVPFEHNVIMQALGIQKAASAPEPGTVAYAQWFIETLKAKLGQT